MKISELNLKMFNRCRNNGAQAKGTHRLVGLAKQISLERLLERIAEYFGLELGSLNRGGRKQRIVEARGVACYFAVRELEYSGVLVGEALRMMRSGVCLTARRGEVFVMQNHGIKEKVLG